MVCRPASWFLDYSLHRIGFRLGKVVKKLLMLKSGEREEKIKVLNLVLKYIYM